MSPPATTAMESTDAEKAFHQAMTAIQNAYFQQVFGMRMSHACVDIRQMRAPFLIALPHRCYVRPYGVRTHADVLGYKRIQVRAQPLTRHPQPTYSHTRTLILPNPSSSHTRALMCTHPLAHTHAPTHTPTHTHDHSAGAEAAEDRTGPCHRAAAVRDPEEALQTSMRTHACANMRAP